MEEGPNPNSKPDTEGLSYFTNPQGVWNEYIGTWDVPDGRTWNGRYWKPSRKERTQKAGSDTASRNHSGGKQLASRGERKARPMVVRSQSGSDEDSEPEPPAQPTKRRKGKGAVRQVRSIDTEVPTKEAKNPALGECRAQVEDDEEDKEHDGSFPAAVAAAGARMDEELTEKDDGRARRYVATVGPAMAALRFVRADRKESATEEGGATSTHDVSAAEEGGGMADSETDVPESDTGGAKVVTPSGRLDPAPIRLGEELSDEQLHAFGIMAKVRSAVKQAKREMKRQWAERVRHKKKRAVDEVDKAVEALNHERRRRRKQQAVDARAVMARRRQVSALERRDLTSAQISLVQRTRRGSAVQTTDEA
ncbi:hypothetical protein PF003_g11303 [Phytophthora fragariae]|nr:hypothetical protein PF003_g11303 [Phytophthora fragariae]